MQGRQGLAEAQLALVPPTAVATSVAQRGFAPLAPVEFGGRTYYLYGFDGHLHTDVSPDAEHAPRDVLAGAKRNGLDAIIFTDHGSPRANTAIGQKGGLLTFAGQEIGGPFGHAVLWNVSAQQSVAPSKTSLAQRAAFAHAHGGLIVLCHPGWWIEGRAEDPLRWLTPEALADGGMSADIDALELWNGVYDAPLRKLIGVWETALVAGAYVPIVGGSDFHRFHAHRLGSPRNVAYCDRPEPASCLWDAVRSGRLYVTGGPSLLFAVDDKPMGETVAARAGEPLRVQLRALSPRGGELRVMLGRERVHTLALAPGIAGEERFQLPAPAGNSFVRIEIVHGVDERVDLLSNPIFVRAAP